MSAIGTEEMIDLTWRWSAFWGVAVEKRICRGRWANLRSQIAAGSAS